MIDTHTHLYFAADYPDGGEAAVGRAFEAGVTRMVLPNVNLASAGPLIALHSRTPGITYAAPGLHPGDVEAGWKQEVDRIFEMFAEIPVVAVGEVGVDLYRGKETKLLQMDAFGCQLDLAGTMGLPVIIHSRAALDETLHMLAQSGPDVPPLIWHSFTAGRGDMDRILEAYPDSVFGINGVVTFKNAPELREAVRAMGINRIVLETDSPYLSPVPLRGRTNESSHLPHILAEVAGICGIPPSEAERITDLNAMRIFRF